MEWNQVLTSRRSIRKFVPGGVVREEEVHEILTAAMLAPSACGKRPWHFTVIWNPQIKEKLAAYKLPLTDAACAIVVEAFPDIQTDSPADGYWQQDCGAAVENMLLQCTALGLGSCWCGLYPRERNWKAFREILGLSGIPVAVVAIGKAAEAPEKRGFYEEEKVTVIR